MLADRMRRIEPSGIRRIFELMATMENPINLSIGQAHNMFVAGMVGQVKANRFEQRIGHARVEIDTQRRKPTDKILRANQAYVLSGIRLMISLIGMQRS